MSGVKFLLASLAGLLTAAFVQAQSVGINTTGASPHTTAMLDIQSTTKGLLIPRMQQTERTAISSPADGLVVYQNNNTKGFYYFDGTNWTYVSGPFFRKNNIVHNLNWDAGVASDTLWVFGDDKINSTTDKIFFSTRKVAFRAGRNGGNNWNNDSLGLFSAAFGTGTLAKGMGSFAAGTGAAASGEGAVATGIATVASGEASFATGFLTVASGKNSFAVTNNAKATNENTVAIGNGAQATGQFAIAIGQGVRSMGYSSLALGTGTFSEGVNSTSTGYATKAAGQYSMANGFMTIARTESEAVFGQFNDTTQLSTSGWQNQAPLIIAGNGSSHVARSNAWVLYKDGSHELRLLTAAPASTANRLFNLNGELYFNDKPLQEGIFTKNNNIIASKNWNSTTDDSLFIFGGGQINNTSTHNDNNRLLFWRTKGAFRAGSNFNALVWDKDSIGEYSAALNGYNVASGRFSFASGVQTRAIAYGSFTSGIEGVASGNGSAAFGSKTKAEGDYSMAIGAFTKASGDQSFAIGNNSTASGFISFGAGSYSQATGTTSTAFGQSTIAEGTASTTIGFASRATGDYSLAGGSNTRAYGTASVALGYSSDANSYAQLTIGRYNDQLLGTSPDPDNWSENDALFVAGNGTGNLGRSNAMTLFKDGSLEVQKSIKVGSAASVLGNIQKNTVVLGSCANTNGYCFFTVSFTTPYSTPPSVVIATPVTEAGQSFPDTFSATVRNITNTGFTVNIQRTDMSSFWGQQLRLSWIAIQ